jgi:hypothetical protein
MEEKQLDSPDQIKQENSAHQTIQEGTNSTQKKPTHKSPVKVTKLGTDHHNKAQPKIPESNERDEAKTRRKRRRRKKSVSYSEVIPQ